jgi:uncharacterized YigZ family protein
MNSEKRLIPLEEVENEILVVNSRFIASLAPAKSVEEAREYIAEIKRRYPDATHNVPAFVIGHGKSLITHCSDDGEPSGTSGRPALAVLQGSGLGNVVVVVTRYFGGTKLGTGGLVKAYGDAVREILPLVKLAELVETVTLAFTIPYNLYELCVRLIETRFSRLKLISWFNLKWKMKIASEQIWSSCARVRLKLWKLKETRRASSRFRNLFQR